MQGSEVRKRVFEGQEAPCSWVDEGEVVGDGAAESSGELRFDSKSSKKPVEKGQRGGKCKGPLGCLRANNQKRTEHSVGEPERNGGISRERSGDHTEWAQQKGQTQDTRCKQSHNLRLGPMWG